PGTLLAPRGWPQAFVAVIARRRLLPPVKQSAPHRQDGRARNDGTDAASHSGDTTLETHGWSIPAGVGRQTPAICGGSAKLSAGRLRARDGRRAARTRSIAAY